VLYAHELGLVPITTPAYSPESNGLAEGFVHTFKRDYVNVHELRDAESVLAQLAAWIDDYNRLAPHSALGMRSPADYRAVTSANREFTPPSVQDFGERISRVLRCAGQLQPEGIRTGLQEPEPAEGVRKRSQ
jgi:Integrase core domain